MRKLPCCHIIEEADESLFCKRLHQTLSLSLSPRSSKSVLSLSSFVRTRLHQFASSLIQHPHTQSGCSLCSAMFTASHQASLPSICYSRGPSRSFTCAHYSRSNLLSLFGCLQQTGVLSLLSIGAALSLAQWARFLHCSKTGRTHTILALFLSLYSL